MQGEWFLASTEHLPNAFLNFRNQTSKLRHIEGFMRLSGKHNLSLNMCTVGAHVFCCGMALGLIRQCATAVRLSVCQLWQQANHYGCHKQVFSEITRLVPQLTSIKDHLRGDGEQLVAVNSYVFGVNLWCRETMAWLWISSGCHSDLWMLNLRWPY